MKATGAELIVVLQLEPSSAPSVRLAEEGHRVRQRLSVCMTSGDGLDTEDCDIVLYALQ